MKGIANYAVITHFRRHALFVCRIENDDEMMRVPSGGLLRDADAILRPSL
jgi:hypothetical protein